MGNPSSCHPVLRRWHPHHGQLEAAERFSTLDQLPIPRNDEVRDNQTRHPPHIFTIRRRLLFSVGYIVPGTNTQCFLPLSAHPRVRSSA